MGARPLLAVELLGDEREEDAEGLERREWVAEADAPRVVRAAVLGADAARLEDDGELAVGLAMAELDQRAVFWLLSSRVFINMHVGDFDFAAPDADTAAAAAPLRSRPHRRPDLSDAQRGRAYTQQYLGFSALELVAVWQRHLGAVLRWLAAHRVGASELMEAVAQLEPIPSGGGGMHRRAWASMVGCGCAGRCVFVIVPT